MLRESFLIKNAASPLSLYHQPLQHYKHFNFVILYGVSSYEPADAYSYLS